MISILIILLISSSAKAASESACLKSNNECARSSDCCSGCCSENKCIDYAESCQSELAKLGGGKGGPCANLDPPCKTSHTCVLQKVHCFRAPCNPVPTCVPPDYRDYD